MRKERRNYYRILHVQPEAPVEIIVASYRSMMSKLRHHPDLGGDHETAILINEAYTVLSDPQKRRAYDQARRRMKKEQTLQKGGVPNAGGSDYRPVANLKECAYCAAAAPAVIIADTRCARCDSPLASICSWVNDKRELLGRRRGTRVSRTENATIHVGLNTPPSPARLKDLSPTGLSLITPVPVNLGTTVRVISPNVDIVARVVGVRTRDWTHILHGKLLTAWFASHSGVFVSTAV